MHLSFQSASRTRHPCRCLFCQVRSASSKLCGAGRLLLLVFQIGLVVYKGLDEPHLAHHRKIHLARWSEALFFSKIPSPEPHFLIEVSISLVLAGIIFGVFNSISVFCNSLRIDQRVFEDRRAALSVVVFLAWTVSYSAPAFTSLRRMRYLGGWTLSRFTFLWFGRNDAVLKCNGSRFFHIAK